jgi:hypothetical protein
MEWLSTTDHNWPENPPPPQIYVGKHQPPDDLTILLFYLATWVEDGQDCLFVKFPKEMEKELLDLEFQFESLS